MISLEDLSKKISGRIEGDSPRLPLKGISSNSKKIAPGFLFILKRADEEGYAAEALQKGAIALAAERSLPAFASLPQLIHPDMADLEGLLASYFYQKPSEELFMVGVTGTNGKTTTAYLIKQLLDYFSMTSGLIGTVEYFTGKRTQKADRTTPDAVTNQALLREMVNGGCRSAVMEVSSHGLVQGRVNAIEFDAALFTNLTQDHLDYHRSMEEYCEAKSKLFSSLGDSKWAVVNRDSPWLKPLLKECRANILTYGVDQPANLIASEISFERGGTRALIDYEGKKVACFWPLVGRFNLYNVLGAIGVLLTRGIRLEWLQKPLSQLVAVPGRLQKIENPLNLSLYVDYAHTEDALENVLRTLKEVHREGKKIVVVGCGGDRDRLKRPTMAKVCEEHADHLIITSDNPRSENPDSICADMVAGLSAFASYEIEIDRKEAIKKAIQRAGRDDSILIAGKGHETYQVFADHTLDFDDRSVALEICLSL